MLRLLGYSYHLRRPDREKALVIELGLGLMRAFTWLAERAVRLPAGPSHPVCATLAGNVQRRARCPARAARESDYVPILPPSSLRMTSVAGRGRPP